MEEMMDKMMRDFFESFEKGEVKTYGPYIYGFSISVGPDGKPVIRQFGNVKPPFMGKEAIKEEREPLVDIMTEKDEIIIVAELPGVEKNDIKLNATEKTLTISVDTPKRKYYKELELPEKVDPKSAKASYKNGVLEVRLKKAAKVSGEIIPID